MIAWILSCYWWSYWLQFVPGQGIVRSTPEHGGAVRSSNDNNPPDRSKPKADVIDFWAERPAITDEVICVFCGGRGMCTYPEGLYLKDLECAGCGKVGGCVSTGCYQIHKNLEDYHGEEPDESA